MNESNSTIKDELNLQLHEQYAINNNEGVKSFIAFLTAILALFGAFGYVVVNTDYQMSNGNKLLVCQGYAFEVYVGVALVMAIMLTFLAEISLSLGFGQRHNHIIIQRIRESYYDRESYEGIFKNSYKAKNKSVCDFVPDIYNIFYWMFVVAQLIVVAVTIYQCSCMGWQYCVCWILLIVQIGLIVFCLHRRCCHYYCKYQQIQ